MKIGKLRRTDTRLVKYTTPFQKAAVVIRILIAIILVLFLIWSQNNLIITKNYIFTSDRIPKTFVDYNIVVVSDIHNSNLNIASVVSRANPDIIVVSGGLTDSRGNYNNSVKTIEKLSRITQTYYVIGDNDVDMESELCAKLDSFAINLDGKNIQLEHNEIDIDSFINKYIGSKIIKDASAGDEDTSNYIKYTTEKLQEDNGKTINLAGIGYISSEDTIGLPEKIYSYIGTDKETFQIFAANQASQFDNISNLDIDLVFSGETHGISGKAGRYTKGIYSSNGTTLFLSSGIGNLDNEESRIFNYPEILSIRLSDGTIKQENPLEKFLSMFISDVSTKFDNDGGFKEYTYTFGNEYIPNY